MNVLLNNTGFYSSSLYTQDAENNKANNVTTKICQKYKILTNNL